MLAQVQSDRVQTGDAQSDQAQSDQAQTYEAQSDDASSVDSVCNSSCTNDDITGDEKFELLSAYLDDEVTEEERALVNHWLASDPEMKAIYNKQRQLQLAIQALL